MATSLDDLVNITGVILAFEFTPDGTCTSYKNVTREMAAMICRFCAAVTMNFNALASGSGSSENHPACQARYVWVAGSIPDSAQSKRKQALISACFYSGGRT